MPDRNQQDNTSNRGFASMPKDQQREIAAQGGRSVPDEKRSFSQDHDLASRAGQQSHSGSQSGSNSRSGSDNGNSRNH